MKIFHISDTHCQHDYVSIPKGIDMIIHSGDCSNNKNPYMNEGEVHSFLKWYSKQEAQYKILVAGNHDTSIEKRLITKEKMWDDYGVIYLEHDSIEIEGFKIFGSPYTPSFHNWAFNIPREDLFHYWEQIPEDTNILITHGPPMFILDTDNNEQLGCKSLYKKLSKLPNLIIHQFGHIHNRLENSSKHINRGIFQEYTDGPKYINASFVTLHHKPQLGNLISII